MITLSPARRIAMLSGIAAVASACAVLVLPTAASAATSDGIELSNDGVTFGAQLTAPLYSADLRVIPQTSHDASFWVRNDSDEVGFLRIVLSDVSGNNTDLLGALSLQASTPTTVGIPAALTSAQPCRALTQGAVLAPGDSIRIDTSLAIADLVGVAGQSGSVGFGLQVGMSSVDPAGTPATTCVVAGSTVPVFPSTPTYPNAAPVAEGSSTATTAVLGRGVQRTTATGSAAPVTPTTPVAGREGLDPMPYPFVLFQLTNSLRLFQEDIVFLWVMSAMIGALCVLILTRRRRRADKNGAVQ